MVKNCMGRTLLSAALEVDFLFAGYKRTQSSSQSGGQECPPHGRLGIVNPLVFTLYKTLLPLTDSLPPPARRALLITKERRREGWWVKPPKERKRSANENKIFQDRGGRSGASGDGGYRSIANRETRPHARRWPVRRTDAGLLRSQARPYRRAA